MNLIDERMTKLLTEEYVAYGSLCVTFQKFEGIYDKVSEILFSNGSQSESLTMEAFREIITPFKDLDKDWQKYLQTYENIKKIQKEMASTTGPKTEEVKSEEICEQTAVSENECELFKIDEEIKSWKIFMDGVRNVLPDAKWIKNYNPKDRSTRNEFYAMTGKSLENTEADFKWFFKKKFGFDSTPDMYKGLKFDDNSKKRMSPERLPTIEEEDETALETNSSDEGIETEETAVVKTDFSDKETKKRSSFLGSIEKGFLNKLGLRTPSNTKTV